MNAIRKDEETVVLEISAATEAVTKINISINVRRRDIDVSPSAEL
jgi:hypothetical protein